MTEAEWFACNNPEELLDFLKEKVGLPRQRDISSRKERLLAVACCRRFSHLLIDDRSSKALDVAEQFADGQATEAQMEAAHVAASEVANVGPNDESWDQSSQYVLPPHERTLALAQRSIAWAATHASDLECWFGHDDTGRAAECEDWGDGHYMHRDAVRGVTEAAEAHLFRDLFGIYFRPVQLDGAWLAWNDGAIKKLAQVIYDDRTFNQLPLLADALEDAGCTNAAILSHCREPGEHVRGCWVVDLLLDRK